MAKLYNLARMTTATTGTGTITLGSAVSGFLSFANAGISDGDTVDYAINDPGTGTATASEIGTGVYTASGTTLTRRVLKSTNSDAPINLSGSAHVFITPSAQSLKNTPSESNVKAYGASGSASTTTGSITAASNSLTLAAAVDFANGQGIRINHAGAAFTLNQATSLTATPQGTTGATTYQYKVSSLDGAGGVGVATSSFQTTTGNATLSSTNYNRLSWTAAAGTAPAGYAVYKNISGTYTLIGVVTGTTFEDTGITSFSVLDWVPSTAPASALADWLVTTITDGAGTTTLTLAATATTTASSVTVTHDDTAAIQAALTANLAVNFPVGTYYISGGLALSAKHSVLGSMGGSIIQSVCISKSIFALASYVQIQGLTIMIAPGCVAFNGSTIAYSVFSDLWCKGSQTSSSEWTYAFNIVDGQYLDIGNIFLTSQVGSTAPPAIAFSATGLNPSNSTSIHLHDVQALNDGAAALSGNWITFNNVYSGDFSHSLLNAFGQAQGTRCVGLLVEGGLQILKTSANQYINFGISVKMDQDGASHFPLGLTVTNSHFDWCVTQAILLNGGGTAIVTDNTFYGESLTGNAGIYFNASFGGPNVITGNTFVGFNGSGSAPIVLNSNTNVNITNNNFVTSNLPTGSIGGTAAVVANNPGWMTGWTTLTKTADTNRASTTTLTADPDLQFKMAANTKYRIRFKVFFVTGAGGASIAVSGPASPTSVLGVGTYDTGGGFANMHAISSYLGSTGLVGGAAAAVSAEYSLVVNNGSTAGTFSVTWAQFSSNAANSTMTAGSYLEYAPIP